MEVRVGYIYRHFSSEIAEEIKKPIATVVKAVDTLEKYGLLIVEERKGREAYRKMVKEIVIAT